jgi:hypothetical protein
VRHLDLWSRLIEDYVALELAAETNLLFVGPTGQYSPYAIAYYENLTEHANGVYREIQDLSSDDFKSLVDRGGRSAPDGTWIGSSQPSRREWLFGKATERVLKIHDRAHDAIENVVNHASDLDRNVRSFALAAVMGATLLDVLQGFNVIRSVQRAVNSALTVARGIRAAEAAFRTTKTTQQLRLIFNRARGHFNELRFMRLSGQQLRQQGKVLVSKPYVRVRGTKDYAIPDYGVFDPKTGAFELLDAKRGLAPLSGPQRKVFESALRNGEIELFGQQAQELIDAMTAFQARSGRQVLEPLVAGTASGARQARVSGIGVWRYRSLDDYGHEPVTLGSLTAR